MRRIVITDYDMVMYKTVKQLLQEDYKISPLPVVEELRDYLVQNNVEIIFLTISEEYSDGFNTYEQIKDIPEMKGKPVIFLAEQSSSWIEEKIMSLGAQDFITIPATVPMLKNKIENFLELHTLRNNREYVEKYQNAIAISFAELMECRDETTGGHLKNTVEYFNILLEEAIANEYYKDLLSLEDVGDLLRSAALHDIGKIGINDDVLRKTSPLDYQEFEYMKTHTTLGKQAFENIIRETGGTRWLYLAKDIAYYHHERWDGNGYPDGLKGEEIPIYARIMTVADVYDALTSLRSYKEAYTHKQAMDIIIRGKGNLFDPRLVELFVNASERFEDVLKKKKGNLD